MLLKPQLAYCGESAPPVRPPANKQFGKRPLSDMLSFSRPVNSTDAPGPDGAGGRAPGTPQSSVAETSRLGKLMGILSNFNPKRIFWDRMKEDIKAFKEAKSTRDEDMIGDPQLVRAKTDLKFIGCFAASEIAGTCIGAPLLGIAMQEATHNAYLGVAGTVIGDYLPAVFTFQVAWAAMNRGFYKNRSDSFLGRAKEFYKDVIPLHISAALAALPAYAVGAALSSSVIATINSFGTHLAEKLKIMPLVSEIINYGVVETIYLALTAAPAAFFVSRIAERYSEYLDKTRVQG
jgi:hypothetical protein